MQIVLKQLPGRYKSLQCHREIYFTPFNHCYGSNNNNQSILQGRWPKPTWNILSGVTWNPSHCFETVCQKEWSRPVRLLPFAYQAYKLIMNNKSITNYSANNKQHNRFTAPIWSRWVCIKSRESDDLYMYIHIHIGIYAHTRLTWYFNRVALSFACILF